MRKLIIVTAILLALPATASARPKVHSCPLRNSEMFSFKVTDNLSCHTAKRALNVLSSSADQEPPYRALGWVWHTYRRLFDHQQREYTLWYSHGRSIYLVTLAYG